PGEKLDDVRAALGQELSLAFPIKAGAGDISLTLSWPASFPAWETGIEDPLVAAMRATSLALDYDARLGAVLYGSDAAHFAEAGVPVVLYGPGDVNIIHS